MEKIFQKKQIKVIIAVILAVALVCVALIAGAKIFSAENNSNSANIGTISSDSGTDISEKSIKENSSDGISDSAKASDSDSYEIKSSALLKGTALTDKSANFSKTENIGTTNSNVNENDDRAKNNANQAVKTLNPTAAVTQSKNRCEIQIVCENAVNYANNHSGVILNDTVKSGVILRTMSVYITDGKTVFDVLKKVCEENKIQLEYTKTPLYNSYYIEGIGDLYEFDCGSSSGWIYKVNGTKPNYSCSEYEVKSGDKITFAYTCKNGADV